eukprot:PhF_6_TR29402/c0_g1_i1/m.43406/K00639/kbl, GCAT; glycine C-acetyltransferase
MVCSPWMVISLRWTKLLNYPKSTTPASWSTTRTPRGISVLEVKVPPYFGVQDAVDIINSTLGKTLGGGSGGFSSGRKQLIELQRQRSRPYLFSNTVPPMIIAGSMKALDIAALDDAPRAALARNVKMFREGMKANGFEVLGNDHCAIAPVLLKDAKLSAAFAQKMLAQGIYVISFSFPVVPKGLARIRVQLSATHTEEDITKVVNAFKVVKEELMGSSSSSSSKL